MWKTDTRDCSRTGIRASSLVTTAILDAPLGEIAALDMVCSRPFASARWLVPADGICGFAPGLHYRSIFHHTSSYIFGLIFPVRQYDPEPRPRRATLRTQPPSTLNNRT